jgi:hypothetical protein
MQSASNRKDHANERKSMNNRFDELAKGMAQSATRRAALKKFGLGLAGMALACFGLANKSSGATYFGYCQVAYEKGGRGPFGGNVSYLTGSCLAVDAATGNCVASFGALTGCTPNMRISGGSNVSPCGGQWSKKHPCSF